MDNENASPTRGDIDPSAIGLTGTYVIDLTAATHSDVAVPDALQGAVS